MKSRFAILTAALLLGSAAHAGSLKSLPLDDTGFAVRNAKGRRLPSELGHDGDGGAAFRFVELNKGRYTFSVSKSGTVKRICVNAAN